MDMSSVPPVERGKRNAPTEAWLRHVYVELGLSVKDIGAILGRSPKTVEALLKNRNIPSRGRHFVTVDDEWLRARYVDDGWSHSQIAEASGLKYTQVAYALSRAGIKGRNQPKRQFVPTRDWLYQKYVVEGLSPAEICRLTGYSKQAFKELRKRYGLPLKGRSLPPVTLTRDDLYQMHVIEGLTAVKIAARTGYAHTTISRLIQRYGLDPARPLVNQTMVPPVSHDVLWKLYWVDQLSIRSIGARYGVDGTTVLRWMEFHDIPRRQWNGPEVYPTYARSRTSTDPDKRNGREFNAAERDAILTRDGWTCKMPGCGCAEKWRLEVHHILPVKYGGDHALDNGITLCTTCHDAVYGREMEFMSLLRSLIPVNPPNE